jgi:uncharacterized lipoprotein YbaY
MTLHLTLESAEPLPRGKPLRIEIRDTSLADAPAVLVQRVDCTVEKTATSIPMTLAVERLPSGSTLWVHVDVDEDGRVSEGDFITMESYPLDAQAEGATTIRLRRVT